MPTYIIKNVVPNGSICQQESSCNSKFFSNLAKKLLEMATAVNKRIEDIKKNCVASRQQGVFLASIETPVMNIGVKYEYIEYIKRFGPPTDGKFEEEKLQQIRMELGINTNAATAL